MEQIFVSPQLELAHQAEHFVEIYALVSLLPHNIYVTNKMQFLTLL